jgi:hypothetical protein
MTNFYACVTYYSLPSFPRSCAMIRNHDLLLRDVLLCNRTNDHHMRGGMQYDPNIENAEYRVCEPSVRRGLMIRAEEYDHLYLIFRTRHMRLDCTPRYLVTGFYRVKKKFEEIHREAPVIHAEAMHFVSVSDCIDATKKIMESRAFRCCFTSENLGWKQHLIEWTTELEKATNLAHKYIKETNRLKRIFRENEFQENPYQICTTCRYCNPSTCSCPLTWRRYHRSIPHQPANYMKNLDEYFQSLVSEGKPIV